MTHHVIRFAGLPVSRWHNGAGRKADIAATADWSVGFAWLDADVSFSDLTGNDRTITLVEGPGFTLDFQDRPALHVAAPFRPAPFDGGWPARCTLLGGAGLVLNAMTARARYRHTVAVLQADAMADIAPPGAEAFYVVLLAGAATVADTGATLGCKDAVHTDGPLVLHAAPGSLACAISIEAVAPA